MTKYEGFTLIELMIVLAISGILMSVVLPAYRGVIDNNRIMTQANLLITSLNLARTEAIKRNGPVTVCKSTDGSSCSFSADGWEEGWMLFSDADRDGNVDVGDFVVHSQGEIDGLTIKPSDGNFVNSILYIADGSTTNSDTFKVCPDDLNTAYARKIFVTRMKPRTSLFDDDDTCP